MPALVRIAERLREAPGTTRWDVWLAAATSAGFLALLAADATHPLLVVALEVFLLF